MEQLMNFLVELGSNNNKTWFENNKNRYKEIQQRFNSQVEKIIDGISTFDPLVKGLNVKDCTYRIYRDVRFSKDKSPYKTHIGAYICPGGKKSGYSGYYFHIEPHEGGFKKGSFLSSGIYMPEPIVLKSIREEILDNGDLITKAIASAKGFYMNHDSKLKKTPLGFPKDSPYMELLKQRDLFVEKPVDDKYLTANDLVEKTIEDFHKTYKLTKILNRAIQFAYEEMM